MSAFETSSQQKQTFEEAQAKYGERVQQISEKMLLFVAICSIMISSMHTLQAEDITSERVRLRLLNQLLVNLPVADATTPGRRAERSLPF
jgi:hypothetical protein